MDTARTSRRVNAQSVQETNVSGVDMRLGVASARRDMGLNVSVQNMGSARSVQTSVSRVNSIGAVNPSVSNGFQDMAAKE